MKPDIDEYAIFDAEELGMLMIREQIRDNIAAASPNLSENSQVIVLDEAIGGDFDLLEQLFREEAADAGFELVTRTVLGKRQSLLTWGRRSML